MYRSGPPSRRPRLGITRCDRVIIRDDGVPVIYWGVHEYTPGHQGVHNSLRHHDDDGPTGLGYTIPTVF